MRNTLIYDKVEQQPKLIDLVDGTMFYFPCNPDNVCMALPLHASGHRQVVNLNCGVITTVSINERVVKVTRLTIQAN